MSDNIIQVEDAIGIYLPLENKTCPNCGKDLSSLNALALDMINEPLGSISTSFHKDGTVVINEVIHYKKKNIRDVCCGNCLESFMHVLYLFHHNTVNRESCLQDLIERMKSDEI